MTYVDKTFKRVSSESAYLTPDVLARKNLTVAIHATVTKVLFNTTSTQPKAIGVEFGRKDGERLVAYAKKEVVVSYVYFLSAHSALFLRISTQGWRSSFTTRLSSPLLLSLLLTTIL